MAGDLYDAVLDGLPAPDAAAPEPDLYDQVLDAQAREEQGRLRLALNAGLDRQPDTFAQVLDASDRLQIPAQYLEQNMPEAERMLRLGALDPAGLLKDYPRTAAELTNADFAGVAHDDVDSLTTFEKLTRGAGNLGDSVSVGFDRGRATHDIGMLGFKREFANSPAFGLGAFTPDDAVRLARAERVAKEIGRGDDTALGYIAANTAEVIGQMTPAITRGLESGSVLGLGFGAVGLAAGPAAPVTAPTAAAAGFAAGFTKEMTLDSFYVEAGHAAKELRQLRSYSGDALDDDVVRGAALAVGTVNAALEVTGLGLAGRIFAPRMMGKLGLAQLKQEILSSPTTARALAAFGRKVAAGTSVEVVQEVLQETVTLLGGFAARQVDGGAYAEPSWSDIADRLGNVALKTAAGTVLLAGAGSTLSLYVDTQRAREAANNKALYEALGDTAAASKLRARAPARFQAAYDSIAAGTPVEGVYVKADKLVTLFQADPRTPESWGPVLDALPSVREELQTALATDGFVRIPVGEFAAKLADTDAYRALADDVKFRPNDFTLREAKDWEANYAADFARELALAQQDAEAAAEIASPAEQVQTDVVRMLRNAGVSNDVSTQYGALWRAFFTTVGARAGVAPDVLMQRYAPLIQGEAQRLAGRQAVERLDLLLDRLRTGRRAEDTALYGPSLLDFLTERGGVQDQGGELSARDLDKRHLGKPFARRTVRDDGADFEAAARAAIEAGYLSDAQATSATSLEGLLLDAIDRELAGQPVYSERNRDAQLVEETLQADDLARYLEELGLDLQTATNEEVKAALREATADLPAQDATAPGRVLEQTAPGPDARFEAAARAAIVHRVSTFDEARAAAATWRENPLVNEASGLIAVVSRNNLDKMLNGKAVGKSETPALHAVAVANLDSLFRTAVLGWSKPDVNGDPNIVAIHRFFAPAIVDGKALLAKMTVKELVPRASRENGLYSVEAVTFEGETGPAATWVGEIANADGIDPSAIRSAGPVEMLAQQVQDFNRRRPTAAATEGLELAQEVDPRWENWPTEWPRTLPDDHPDLAQTLDIPGREALREAIIADALKGAVRVEGRKPIAYLMGGGGGAGKGTVRKYLAKRGEMPGETEAGLVTLDPDAVKGSIPEFDRLRLAGDSRAAVVTHEESSFIAGEIFNRALELGADLVYDRTFSGEAKGLREIAALKAAGYEVRMIGVTAPTEAAVARADMRGKSKGRYVPNDVLREAHRGYSAAFPAYTAAVDSFVLYDNTAQGADPLLMAQGLGGSVEILEPESYTAFEEKANEQQTEAVAADPVAADARADATGRIPEATGPAGRGGQSGARSGDSPSGDAGVQGDVREVAPGRGGVRSPDEGQGQGPDLTELSDEQITDTPLRDQASAVRPGEAPGRGSGSGRGGSRRGFGQSERPGLQGKDDSGASGNGRLGGLGSDRREGEQGLTELFQAARGSIQFPGDGRPGPVTINLFRAHDLSTFLHESGHFFLYVLEDLSAQESAPAELRADFAAALKWMGAKPGEAITVEQHEKFARGFEAYLFEGKAPSLELESLFERFRSWLVSVYRSILRLDVELSDDIRSVFDRLLASEDAIEAAAAELNQRPMFEDAQGMGVTVREFEAYRQAVGKAHDAAVARLTAKALREHRQRRTAEYEAMREQVAREVAAELDADRRYRALQFLRFGTFPGEETATRPPLKLDRAALVDLYGGPEILKRLPGAGASGIYRREGGVHPDIAAELLGFSSGDELVMTLVNLEPRAKALQEITDQRMRDMFGDFLRDGSLEQEALAAAHGDEQLQVLATESDVLNRRNGQRVPPLAAVRRMARETIARAQVARAGPGQYVTAERRAARAAERALVKGDFAEAARQKRIQMLNHALAREAVEARDAIDAGLEFFARFDKESTRKRVDPEYLEQIDALLERFDMRRSVSRRALAKRQSLLEWVEQQRAAGREPAVDERLLREAGRRSYKVMTVEEFRGLVDTVKSIDHLGKLKRKLLQAQDRRNFLEVVDELVAATAQHPDRKQTPLPYGAGPFQPVRDALVQFNADHIRPEFAFEYLDQQKPGGAWWTRLFKPLADAEAAELTLRAEKAQVLMQLMNRYSRTERARWYLDRRYFPSLGTSLNKSERLALALNWGNEINRQRIMTGHGRYGWTLSGVQEVLDTLDARDWEFVQGVWDLIDSLWPAASELQFDLSGVKPEKVEALPVQTAFGELRGGYYPLKYDRRLSERASQLEEKQATRELFGGGWARAQTRQGHLKARQENVTLPVLLDLTVLTEHLENVIHDVTHRRAVIDVNRLLQDDRVEQEIKSVLGTEFYRRLNPWLMEIASDRAPPAPSFANGLIRRARHGMTVVSMGWKLTTMMLQPLGYTQSVALLGERWALRGLKDVYGKPWRFKRTLDFVFERSPMMRNRMSNFDRDVRDFGKSLGAKGLMREIEATLFAGIGFLDMAVSLPTWMGAYAKGLKDFANDEAKAVAYADSAVRQSQGSGSPKDLPAVQRGTDLHKMFTMFYSYFSVLNNMLRRTKQMARSPGDVPRAALSVLYLVVLPAVLSELVLGRGPEDDEDPLAWAAKKSAAYPLASVVFLRDVLSPAVTGYGYQLSPVADALGFWADTAQSAAEGDFDEQFFKGAANALGVVLKLPTRQAWLTGDYLSDYFNGEIDEFSVYDMLVTGNRDD
jgi:predicted ABC-type ATPase